MFIILRKRMLLQLSFVVSSFFVRSRGQGESVHSLSISDITIPSLSYIYISTVQPLAAPITESTTSTTPSSPPSSPPSFRPSTTPSATTSSTTTTSSSVETACTGCFVLQNIALGIQAPEVYSTSGGPLVTIATDYPLQNVGTITFDDYGYLGDSVSTDVNLALLVGAGSALESPTIYYYLSMNTVMTRTMSDQVCSAHSISASSFPTMISITANVADFISFNVKGPSIFTAYRSIPNFPTPICRPQDQNQSATDSLPTQSTSTDATANLTAGSDTASSSRYLSQPARIGIGVGLGFASLLMLCTLCFFVLRKRRRAMARLGGDETCAVEADGKSKSELDSVARPAESDGQMRHELKSEVPMYELPTNESEDGKDSVRILESSKKSTP